MLVLVKVYTLGFFLESQIQLSSLLLPYEELVYHPRICGDFLGRLPGNEIEVLVVIFDARHVAFDPAIEPLVSLGVHVIVTQELKIVVVTTVTRRRVSAKSKPTVSPVDNNDEPP